MLMLSFLLLLCFCENVRWSKEYNHLNLSNWVLLYALFVFYFMYIMIHNITNITVSKYIYINMSNTIIYRVNRICQRYKVYELLFLVELAMCFYSEYNIACNITIFLFEPESFQGYRHFNPIRFMSMIPASLQSYASAFIQLKILIRFHISLKPIFLYLIFR